MKNLVEFFKKAEQFVRNNGFDQEIDWCDRRPSFDLCDEQRFLHEYAWVVFNSGMRNRVVAAKWNALKEAFEFFHRERIIQNQATVMKNALRVFGNYKKVAAVIDVATDHLSKWLEFHDDIRNDTLATLDALPFIGPVTKYHLARNLGFDYIKPDRHLIRLSAQFNMTPFVLCEKIHQATGRRLGTVDVILWRYCEQKGQVKL